MSSKYNSEPPLPGGVEQYFDTLIQLLQHIRDEPSEHESLISWIVQNFPSATQSTAINGYIGLISRMELWATKDKLIRLTLKGLDLVEIAAKSTHMNRA